MSLDDHTKRWLTDLLGSRVTFDEPMAGHTYFRVGGPADALATPDNLADLSALIRRTVRAQLPYWIIGDGTNLLVTDAGIRGIVIALTKGFDAIRQAGSTGGDILVTAMAGARMQALCRFAAANGLAGMNFAVGIPGTVGGGLMMNAGTAAGAMADVVDAITVMDAAGETRKIDRDQLTFEYRRLSWAGLIGSAPGRGPVIVEGCVRLHKADPAELKAEARMLLDTRRKTQPMDQPSAGCFFKNPPSGKTAGELIELAGLKGKKIGGAQISAKHANFIVNRGGATAGDILKLSRYVRETVAEKFNIQLEPEVKIVGS